MSVGFDEPEVNTEVVDQGAQSREGVPEITDRIKAIARGEDPDAVAPEATGDATDAHTDSIDGGAGQGSQTTAGGTDAPPTTSWVNDEVRKVADQYGISNERLGEFDSVKEFRNAIRLLDEVTTTDQAIHGEADDGEKIIAETPPTNDLIDPDEYEQAGYDDTIVKLAKTARALQDKINGFDKEREAYQQKVQQQQQVQQQSLEATFINASHDALDKLDPALFGGDSTKRDAKGSFVPIPKEFASRRQEVIETLQVLLQREERSAKIKGRAANLPSSEQELAAWVARASRIAFPKSPVVDTVQQLQQQANTRRGVGRPKQGSPDGPVSHPRTEDEIARNIAANPKIQQKWRELTGTNG